MSVQNRRDNILLFFIDYQSTTIIASRLHTIK